MTLANTKTGFRSVGFPALLNFASKLGIGADAGVKLEGHDPQFLQESGCRHVCREPVSSRLDDFKSSSRLDDFDAW